MEAFYFVIECHLGWVPLGYGIVWVRSEFKLSVCMAICSVRHTSKSWHWPSLIGNRVTSHCNEIGQRHGLLEGLCV